MCIIFDEKNLLKNHWFLHLANWRRLSYVGPFDLNGFKLLFWHLVTTTIPSSSKELQKRSGGIYKKWSLLLLGKRLHLWSVIKRKKCKQLDEYYAHSSVLIQEMVLVPFRHYKRPNFARKFTKIVKIRPPHITVCCMSDNNNDRQTPWNRCIFLRIRVRQYFHSAIGLKNIELLP